jgi:hypothetical protein
MADSIWKTLSAIDCSAHVEQKGGFSYLAWTWAWAMVKERYPEARYHLLEDLMYPDGTLEVRVSVEIENLAHTMWLPVLDFRNKAIQHPDAFAVNTSRMRVLVKCLAMFGLGHYIYAGESLPQVPAEPDYTDEQREEYISLMAGGDGFAIKKFAGKVGVNVLTALFNSAPKGQKSAHKAKYRELVNEANAQLKLTLAALELAAAEENPDHLREIFDELTPVEREVVDAGINEVLMTQINNLI